MSMELSWKDVEIIRNKKLEQDVGASVTYIRNALKLKLHTCLKSSHSAITLAKVLPNKLTLSLIKE